MMFVESVADALHQLHPILGWEVGDAVKGLGVRHEKNVQRPAAANAHKMYGVHIDSVDVGPLLAIDFDANKVFVHYSRYAFLLEAFALHHVAPMASRVADTDQYGFVFSPGF